MSKLLLTYYGDDFTGSTDVLEALTLAGVRTVLFLTPPTPDLLHERFADLQAFGIAGMSRSWTPAQMDQRLPPIYAQLRATGAPLIHYKVCSTFDSSPSIGSIGRALDLGATACDTPLVPLLVGAPPLRRYTLFGNLFATVGSETYRLDRHPTMAHHPVTPMGESDLRRHLAQQTQKPSALFDILHLGGSDGEVDQRFAQLREQGAAVVLFDVLEESHLATIGRLIWQMRGDQPLFVVGSSGVEYALTAYWRASGRLPPLTPPAPAAAADKIIVVSGSCSPETEQQIRRAAATGFAVIALDTPRLVDPATADAAADAAIRLAASALAAGRSVVLHTSLGPHDPQIAATRAQLAMLGLPSEQMADFIGTQLGRILAAVVRQYGVRRVVVAGGDTSGHVTSTLGIYALDMLTPIAPGSPLCRGYAADPAIDGIEIALKGGQVGKVDYFAHVRQGSNSR
ncbi:MAG TPA: four-carbon acid sugar kinase family protein [Roseiflexaceae bacterium]|nr:four-carbon acid sugar kinase family protein [Roseiflexaceae bacterium]